METAVTIAGVCVFIAVAVPVACGALYLAVWGISRLDFWCFCYFARRDYILQNVFYAARVMERKLQKPFDPGERVVEERYRTAAKYVEKKKRKEPTSTKEGK